MAESDDSEEVYSNIRHPDMLGPFIGKRVVDITQHDKDEWEETQQSYVQLHFEDGSYIKFPVGDEPFEIHIEDAGGEDYDIRRRS